MPAHHNQPADGFVPAAPSGTRRRVELRWDACGAVMAIVVSAFGLGLINPSGYPLKTRLLAMVVIGIGAAPMIRWLLRRRPTGMPVFEIYMLFHAICFGYAGLMPQASTLTARIPVSLDEWDTALIAVAASLCCTAAGYYGYTLLRPPSSRTLAWPFRFDASALRLALPAILLAITSTYMLRQSIPLVLQQVTQVVVLLWFVILVVAALRREIPGPVRSLILYGLVPINALLFSTFADAALYGLFGILIPVGLARFVVSKRVPLILSGLVILVFVALQPVKGDYRRGAVGRPTDASPIVDFASLALERFAGQRDAGFSTWDWFADAFKRLNHLHVTAAVIADTPAYVPYAAGETYAPLVTKWVPRMLWPDKPLEAQGNAWAQRYGYLYKGDDVTSFNLPFIPEMYMNFGYPGIVTIACLLGVMMGFVASRLWMHEGDCSLIAYGIVIALPFLTPESNLSLLLGRGLISAAAGYGSLAIMALVLPGLRVGRTSVVAPVSPSLRVVSGSDWSGRVAAGK
jgi:hypothetical protein